MMKPCTLSSGDDEAGVSWVTDEEEEQDEEMDMELPHQPKFVYSRSELLNLRNPVPAPLSSLVTDPDEAIRLCKLEEEVSNSSATLAASHDRVHPCSRRASRVILHRNYLLLDRVLDTKKDFSFYHVGSSCSLVSIITKPSTQATTMDTQSKGKKKKKKKKKTTQRKRCSTSMDIDSTTTSPVPEKSPEIMEEKELCS